MIALFLFLCNILLVLATCPENGVLSYGNNGKAVCYLYERFPAKFLIAEQNCRRSGGHLTSVNDALINDFIAQMGSEAFEVMGETSFWIGGHNLRASHHWQWTDDSHFEFTNWIDGEPTENACLGLLVNGSWQGVDCFLDKPYVCQVAASVFPTTPTPVKNLTSLRPLTTTSRATTHRIETTRTTTVRPTTRTTTTQKTTTKKHVNSCPRSWSYLQKTGLCYRVVSTVKSPLGCFQYGGVEGSIHSKEENDLVGELARNKDKYKDVKVQLSLLKGVDSKWHWADKTATDYTNWTKSEKDFWSCARLNTKLDGAKNTWTSVSCFIPSDYLICTKQP